MPFGIVLTWVGYLLIYYGYNTITSGNETLMQLGWPGRYQPQPRDAKTTGGNLNQPSNTRPATGSKAKSSNGQTTQTGSGPIGTSGRPTPHPR